MQSVATISLHRGQTLCRLFEKMPYELGDLLAFQPSPSHLMRLKSNPPAHIGP